jgi:hypothetical protein
VSGVVHHHRRDPSNVGDQKQSEKPRAKAALCVQPIQRVPLDVNAAQAWQLIPYREIVLRRCCVKVTAPQGGGFGAQLVAQSPARP